MKIVFNPEKKKLLGALVGIARSLDGGNETPETSFLLSEGILALKNGKAHEIQKRLAAEKEKLVPDCFHCQNPCGKTFDLDFAELERQSGALFELKILLLEKLTEYAEKKKETNTPPSLAFLGEMLFSIGYEFFTEEALKEKIKKAENEIKKEG